MVEAASVSSCSKASAGSSFLFMSLDSGCVEETTYFGRFLTYPENLALTIISGVAESPPLPSCNRPQQASYSPPDPHGHFVLAGAAALPSTPSSMISASMPFLMFTMTELRADCDLTVLGAIDATRVLCTGPTRVDAATG